MLKYRSPWAPTAGARQHAFGPPPCQSEELIRQIRTWWTADRCHYILSTSARRSPCPHMPRTQSCPSYIFRTEVVPPCTACSRLCPSPCRWSRSWCSPVWLLGRYSSCMRRNAVSSAPSLCLRRPLRALSRYRIVATVTPEALLSACHRRTGQICSLRTRSQKILRICR